MIHRLNHFKSYESMITYVSLHLANVSLESCITGFKPREDFNGFFLVLNTVGRILFMSDSVEYHLRKNVVCI